MYVHNMVTWYSYTISHTRYSVAVNWKELEDEASVVRKNRERQNRVYDKRPFVPSDLTFFLLLSLYLSFTVHSIYNKTISFTPLSSARISLHSFNPFSSCFEKSSIWRLPVTINVMRNLSTLLRMTYYAIDLECKQASSLYIVCKNSVTQQCKDSLRLQEVWNDTVNARIQMYLVCYNVGKVSQMPWSRLSG